MISKKGTVGPRKRMNWTTRSLLIGFVVALLIGGGVFIVRKSYVDGLKPVSNSQKSELFTVVQGASVQEVAASLKGAQLIRSPRSFEWYFRTKNLREFLQAGTYSLSPSMSVETMAEILTHGRVATDLVTILPAKRIDEIRDGLINAGFTPSSVDAALDPAVYADHPALVDKPRGASLEGYIYPESFQKTTETNPQSIIRASLDEMQKVLTPQVRAGMVRQGLTVHKGIILASIIENEVHTTEDKAKVAQVFLKRLDSDMLLQSDATSKYGAILAGQEPSLTFESKYNTYNHKGLTPTPISNVTKSSIEAVAKPATTDYLYFVSGDTNSQGVSVTYFAKTLEEHERNIERYCTKLCGR